jgi:cell division protease FtsH
MTESRKYPFSQKYFEKYIKQLNSKNITESSEAMFGFNNEDEEYNQNTTIPTVHIILNKNMFAPFLQADDQEQVNGYGGYGDGDEEESPHKRRMRKVKKGKKKSDNFELVEHSDVDFRDVGGYDSIKTELKQCVDLLRNFTKYAKYNVRTPKGLILEGLPGNGKTLLAKALAGEADTNFIAVSGAEFQDTYVGIGPKKIRELFQLAKDNLPCIIFIDEIDALGRARSHDAESASAERDNTLNELLVALDGFKNTSGVFIIGATNRADLLDPALIRPGRIDKRIYIGNPDEKTRDAIVRIHSVGKPRDPVIDIQELVEITSGFSGAQIENLLNEAMLNALRENREQYTRQDLETLSNKMLVGWQPTEHEFSSDIVDHIAIHEMGHAIVGLLSKHHSKVTKVIINLSAPTSPGYTVFETSNTNIYTREALFEHLMILLGGRIAEEEFWGISVTTGAINDFEEVLKLAHRMITYYGMGQHIVYPNGSEKYREIVDNEILQLIQDAYKFSKFIIERSKDFIFESAELLKEKKIVKIEELIELLEIKYPYLLDLKIE